MMHFRALFSYDQGVAGELLLFAVYGQLEPFREQPLKHELHLRNPGAFACVYREAVARRVVPDVPSTPCLLGSWRYSGRRRVGNGESRLVTMPRRGEHPRQA